MAVGCGGALSDAVTAAPVAEFPAASSSSELKLVSGCRPVEMLEFSLTSTVNESLLSETAMQFAADRLQHLERNVEPALKEGRVVVSDRYAYSSMAYQPALQHQKREISRQRVEKLNKDIILPDLAVLIDVDPEIGLERISVRGEKTDYEELEMQRKVRQNYHGMKDREEVVAVDGSKGLGEVHSQITETVENFLDI